MDQQLEVFELERVAADVIYLDELQDDFGMPEVHDVTRRPDSEHPAQRTLNTVVNDMEAYFRVLKGFLSLENTLPSAKQNIENQGRSQSWISNTLPREADFPAWDPVLKHLCVTS